MRLKIFIFCLLVVSSTIVKSQSLIETEDWIKQKFEEYETTIDYGINQEKSYKEYIVRNFVKTSYKIWFSEEGELWITNNRFVSIGKFPENISFLYKIPIKEMKSVKYVYEDNYIIVDFSVWNKNANSLNKSIQWVSFKDGNITKDNFVNEFKLEFDNRFKEDDMPNRFKKAIDHLIILNGGKVVKEVF